MFFEGGYPSFTYFIYRSGAFFCKNIEVGHVFNVNHTKLYLHKILSKYAKRFLRMIAIV